MDGMDGVDCGRSQVGDLKLDAQPSSDGQTIKHKLQAVGNWTAAQL